MLRVTVELVPFGNEELKKKIGSMVIANIGSKEDGTSYEAVIAPDAWSLTPTLLSKVDGWNRERSVWDLIGEVLFKAAPNYEESSIMKRLKERL